MIISKYFLIEDYNRYLETGDITYAVRPIIYCIFMIIVIIVGIKKIKS